MNDWSQYDPNQGNKSNADWMNSQLPYLEELLGTEETINWLIKPHSQLDNQSPIEVIVRRGDEGFKIIGDFISDMLTGSPS